MELIVMNLVLTLVLSLIAIGTVYALLAVNKLKQKLSKEIDKVSDNNTKLLLNDALNRVQTLALDQIDKFSNTITTEINQVKLEGKVPSIEDLQELVIKIKNKTLQELNLSTLQVLKEQTIDIEDYVNDVVTNLLEENFL